MDRRDERVSCSLPQCANLIDPNSPSLDCAEHSSLFARPRQRDSKESEFLVRQLDFSVDARDRRTRATRQATGKRCEICGGDALQFFESRALCSSCCQVRIYARDPESQRGRAQSSRW
jgi:hypothetical protein